MKSTDLYVDKEGVVDFFMAYVEKAGFDINMASFCESTGLDEANVYDHFSSLSQIEKYIWEQLMISAVHTTISDSSYEAFSQREKLLSLYYTFFENCSLNKDFLLASISHHGIYRILPVWHDMKQVFVRFIGDLFSHQGRIKSPYCADEIDKVVGRVKTESLWGQLLFLLDFWRHDDSQDFEKTDVAIEKSVKATMDLVDVTPIKSILDLGKFIWAERINKSTTQ